MNWCNTKYVSDCGKSREAAIQCSVWEVAGVQDRVNNLKKINTLGEARRAADHD